MMMTTDKKETNSSKTDTTTDMTMMMMTIMPLTIATQVTRIGQSYHQRPMATTIQYPN